MVDILQFLQTHRAWIYPLTIGGTFLEGETFVLIAAAAAGSLGLDPLKLGLCAWFGSTAGDQCWFFLGRYCGPWAIRHSARAKAGIELAHRWLERWDVVFILTYRFMYGVRNVSSIALGLSAVPSLRFVTLNIVAAAIWAVIFVGAGVLFGRTAAGLVGHWATTIEFCIAVLFVAVVFVALRFSRQPVAATVNARRDRPGRT
jgi:membrane protein DedA with SNARE-associated domain